MKEFKLAAESRSGSGKGNSRKIRAKGMVPAILYGTEKTPQMIGINDHDFRRLMQTSGGENVLIDLSVGTSRPEKVLLKEIQQNPLTSKILHVDFLRVDLTKKVHVSVPVHVTGTAEGVKAGGILEFASRVLEVSCLPTDIPEHITVDVTNLKIGDSIHVYDLKLEKTDVLTDKQRTIVTVAPPTVIKEAVPAEAAEAVPAEGAEPTEPEVITERKKKEEEEEE